MVVPGAAMVGFGEVFTGHRISAGKLKALWRWMVIKKHSAI
jgi:hypothetical protein